MQTYYYKTRNFVRHDGNVVDLTEYRRKLSALANQSALPDVEADFIPADYSDDAPHLQVLRPLSGLERYIPSRRDREDLVFSLLGSFALLVLALVLLY